LYNKAVLTVSAKGAVYL